MSPDADERLASIVRALSDVVLPSLPAEAGLAKEQVQLCIGHLQILRAQLDHIHDYEAEELADAAALGRMLTCCAGGPATVSARARLREAVASEPGQGAAAIRAARQQINEAIGRLVEAVGIDGDDACRANLSRAILQIERQRSLKDRQWSAAFGFDAQLASA